MTEYSKHWSFELNRYYLCDECKKPRFLLKVESVMWDAQYDWADGDSRQTCVFCLIKDYLRQRKYMIKKNYLFFLAYKKFNKDCKIDYKKYRKLFFNSFHY